MNLPQDFVQYTRKLLGEERFAQLQKGLEDTPSVSLRMNTAKLIFFLGNEAPVEPAVAAVPVPWCGSGYYLTDRPSFTFDPTFHAGAYYVQEAGSMFVEQAIRPYLDGPIVALDLCAAPGGKSTLLRHLLPEGSLLVANEPMRPRVQILAENMVKWGNPYFVVTNNYPADFTPMRHCFDLIVADVPCSGEGMFRKDEGAVNEWSTANVALCMERQREIIRSIWPCLKPGGLLVYSTCTFNQYENEENVNWIVRELGAEVLPVATQEEWGIQGSTLGEEVPVYHFFPGSTRSEGFFLALLRKGEEEEVEEEYGSSAKKKNKGKKDKAKKPAVKVPDDCRKWIRSEAELELIAGENQITAFPKAYTAFYEQLKEHTAILEAGVGVAEPKGKDWCPAHSLAMSTALNQEVFPKVELTEDQALAFLRKEALVLSPDVPKGFVLVTFRNLPLGFVKQIGNRANNLYPDAWRIRSTYGQLEKIW